MIVFLNRYFSPVLVIFAWIFAYEYVHASPELKNIQIGHKQGQTMLILEFSKISAFRMITLDKKFSVHSNEKDATYRLTIDTPHFKTKVTPHLNVEGSDFIALVRYGSYTPQISRIVVETTTPIVINNLQLDISPSSQKLYISLSPTPTFKPLIKQTSNWNTVAEENAIAEQQRQQIQQQSFNKIKSDKNRTKPLIILDAGHGGHDPGAIGINGLYEKDITLEIAKNVKKTLEKSGKFSVLLTRADDRYISLPERSEIPDRVDANLFVSIHADKHSDAKVRGMSVYTLNQDREQREIQHIKQNKTAGNKVKQTFNHVGGQDVSGILGELGMEDSNQSADKFANILVASMKANRIVTLGNPTREASLGVLVARKTPSVLVETAYMSNTYDIVNLQSSKWRQRFSKGLSDAIITYFNTYPVGQ